MANSLPFNSYQIKSLRVINLQQSIMHVEFELEGGAIHRENFVIVWIDQLLLGTQLSPRVLLMWDANLPVPPQWTHLMWLYPGDTEVLP